MWVLLWKHVLVLLGWKSPVFIHNDTVIPTGSLDLCFCLQMSLQPVLKHLASCSAGSGAVPHICNEFFRAARVLFYSVFHRSINLPSEVLIEYLAY